MDRETILQYLSVGVGFVKKGDYRQGRIALEKAKLEAQAKHLDDLVDAAKINLAFSHSNEGNFFYCEGLFDSAREAYQHALNAYQENKESFFRVPQHAQQYEGYVEAFKQALSTIESMPPIEKARKLYLAAQKWHRSGTDHLKNANQWHELGKRDIVTQNIVNGLNKWEVAVTRYLQALKFYEESRISVPEAQQEASLTVQMITDISNASISWATQIGKPDIAKFYLELKQKLQDATSQPV